MAQWQRKLDIKEAWQDAKNGRITYQSLCGTIAEKLKQIEPFESEESIEEERLELVDWFNDLSKTEVIKADDVDNAYGSLCDWGDTKLDDNWNGKRVCWIGTM